jgi:hypothetical protein
LERYNKYSRITRLTGRKKHPQKTVKRKEEKVHKIGFRLKSDLSAFCSAKLDDRKKGFAFFTGKIYFKTYIQET